MIRKPRTAAARAIYALRQVTVEPVFGQIRTRGLVRFWLRGLRNVKAEQKAPPLGARQPTNPTRS